MITTNMVKFIRNINNIVTFCILNFVILANISASQVNQTHNTTELSNNLFNSLTKAYSVNENIKINQYNLLDVVEEFPAAISNYFLPSIVGNVTNSRVLQSTSNPLAENTGYFSKSITLRQPVFNGGGGIASLKKAHYQFLAQREIYYTEEQKIFEQLINIYLTTVSIQERVKIAKTSLKFNETQFNAIKERFRVGEATSTDLANSKAAYYKAKADLANTNTELENVKSAFIQNFHFTPENIQMPDIEHAINYTEDDMQQLINYVIENNTELKSAYYNVMASKAENWVAKSTLLPTVNFEVRASHIDNNQIYPTTTNGNSINTALSVNVPILENGGVNYSNIRKVKNKYKKLFVALHQAEKKTYTNVISQYKKFKEEKIRLTAAKEAKSAAQKAYDGVIEEEKLGSKTILDIQQVEQSLVKAKSDFVDAKQKLLLAYYQLGKLKGHLTAKALGLNVKLFNPEKEFKARKLQIIGF